MSASAEELMRHALGVQARRFHRGLRYTKPYRNHFVAGGDDAQIWDALVEVGHATKRAGTENPIYCVTETGREVALAGITFKRRWGYGAPVHP